MYAWHDTPWMWLTMILFWALIAVAVYYVLSGPRGRSRAPRTLLRFVLECLSQSCSLNSVCSREPQQQPSADAA